MAPETSPDRRMPRSLGMGKAPATCPHATGATRCANPAGAGTLHPGTGYCRLHDRPALHVHPSPAPRVEFREACYLDGLPYRDTLRQSHDHEPELELDDDAA